MLDLNRLNRIHLSRDPLGQKILGTLLLMPNFELPPGMRVACEGLENLPEEPVIFAMNHTDRYNYWPFQYRIWQDAGRFTATWVKGKYYENALMGRFMEWMNNIPTVSRGYLIARDFKAVCERAPTAEEYRVLRHAVDQAAGVSELDEDEAPADLRGQVPPAILEKSRNILGREFRPAEETYPDYINALFRQMMRRFVLLNRQAREKQLNLLIFPQGTRSIQLTRGHIGLAQMAFYLKMPVVPVGCNGSDDAYPGNSPVARPAHITYRIGKPIYPADYPEFAIDAPFEPFTPEAEAQYQENFQGFVDVVMEHINDLLDPRYQFADDLEGDRKKGARRFV